jgi:hypothetical protein
MESLSVAVLMQFLGKFVSWMAKHPEAVVAFLTLGWVVPTFVLTRNVAFYASFDGLFQSVLQASLTNGAFRNPARTANYGASFDADQKAAYEAYAYMVFNVCETIADGLDLYRTSGRSFLDLLEILFGWFLPVSDHRKWLRRTWQPVLIAEKKLHGAWLDNQQSGVAFKPQFLELMKHIEKKKY